MKCAPDRGRVGRRRDEGKTGSTGGVRREGRISRVRSPSSGGAAPRHSTSRRHASAERPGSPEGVREGALRCLGERALSQARTAAQREHGPAKRLDHRRPPGGGELLSGEFSVVQQPGEHGSGEEVTAEHGQRRGECGVRLRRHRVAMGDAGQGVGRLDRGRERGEQEVEHALEDGKCRGAQSDGRPASGQREHHTRRDHAPGREGCGRESGAGGEDVCAGGQQDPGGGKPQGAGRAPTRGVVPLRRAWSHAGTKGGLCAGAPIHVHLLLGFLRALLRSSSRGLAQLT